MDLRFARAYAGLSFTHFQNAFLGYADNSEATKQAQHYASQCLERDSLAPFGHFTMGRAHWLRGELEASLPWLERASALSPNYAQAKYSRAWAEALLGSAAASQANIASALALSPLDPLVCGMLGVRALSHIAREDTMPGSRLGGTGSHSPGAHALIEMIAAVALASMVTTPAREFRRNQPAPAPGASGKPISCAPSRFATCRRATASRACRAG